MRHRLLKVDPALRLDAVLEGVLNFHHFANHVRTIHSLFFGIAVYLKARAAGML